MQNLSSGLHSDAAGKRRNEALRADVARRLRNVCRDWPDEDFARIVDKITRTAIKYAAPLRLDE
ncbi:MAG: hypothetical protein WKF55_03925 [Gemmatimonadaceae bacterium]